MVAEGPRLFLASDLADHRHDAERLRHHDALNEELVPRRDQEAIRAYRAGEGLHAEPDALRPYLPQRDADRHRGLSERLRARVLLRLAVDRDDLLARWPGPPQLRKRAES